MVWHGMRDMYPLQFEKSIKVANDVKGLGRFNDCGNWWWSRGLAWSLLLVLAWASMLTYQLKLSWVAWSSLCLLRNLNFANGMILTPCSDHREGGRFIFALHQKDHLIDNDRRLRLMSFTPILHICFYLEAHDNNPIILPMCMSIDDQLIACVAHYSSESRMHWLSKTYFSSFLRHNFTLIA